MTCTYCGHRFRDSVSVCPGCGQSTQPDTIEAITREIDRAAFLAKGTGIDTTPLVRLEEIRDLLKNIDTRIVNYIIQSRNRGLQ